MELTCEKRNTCISQQMEVNNQQHFCDKDAKVRPTKDKISLNNKPVNCPLLQVPTGRQRMEKIRADTNPCRTVLNARVLLRQLQQDGRRYVSPTLHGRRNSHPIIDVRLPIRNICNRNASGGLPMGSCPLDAPELGKFTETEKLLNFSPKLSHRRQSVSDAFSLNNVS